MIPEGHLVIMLAKITKSSSSQSRVCVCVRASLLQQHADSQ